MAAPCAANALRVGAAAEALWFLLSLSMLTGLSWFLVRAPASIITKPSVEIVYTHGAARNEPCLPRMEARATD